MQEKITIMVNYYTHKNLNDMIREVEREFPLENSFFQQKTFAILLQILIIRMMKDENAGNRF